MTKVDYYVRGTAAKGWDDTSIQGTKTSANENLAELLNVELIVGEFKIASADWKTSYGFWGYQLNGADWTANYTANAPQGGAKDNFGSVDGNNNIKCKVAGTYNFYITSNHQLYVELAEVAE